MRGRDDENFVQRDVGNGIVSQREEKKKEYSGCIGEVKKNMKLDDDNQLETQSYIYKTVALGYKHFPCVPLA